MFRTEKRMERGHTFPSMQKAGGERMMTNCSLELIGVKPKKINYCISD